MKRLLEIMLIIGLMLPALAFAEIAHNYPNISVEADGAGGHVSLVPKTTGQIKLEGPLVRKAATVLTPAVAVTSRGNAPMTLDLHVMATAGPTLAAILAPDVDANLGRTMQVWNKSASPVLIFPQDTDAINAAAVATPYSCATTKLCECTGLAAANWACVSK